MRHSYGTISRRSSNLSRSDRVRGGRHSASVQKRRNGRFAGKSPEKEDAYQLRRAFGLE